MLEKIKSLSLKWKFGIVIFLGMFIVVALLLVALRIFITPEIEAFYGDPGTKGDFVAELLIRDITPIIEENIESQDLERMVNAYRSIFGIYGLSYIFILDAEGAPIVDTFTDRVPQAYIDINPLPEGEKTFHKALPTKDKRMLYDTAIALELPDDTQAVLRLGIVENNPDSPVWDTLKAQHIKGVLNFRVWLLAILLALLFTVLLTVAFWYVIVRRIETISQATERMSFGDLETEVNVKGQDELGTLEETLERMRANLKDAIERLKRRR